MLGCLLNTAMAHVVTGGISRFGGDIFLEEGSSVDHAHTAAHSRPAGWTCIQTCLRYSKLTLLPPSHTPPLQPAGALLWLLPLPVLEPPGLGQCARPPAGAAAGQVRLLRAGRAAAAHRLPAAGVVPVRTCCGLPWVRAG